MLDKPEDTIRLATLNILNNPIEFNKRWAYILEDLVEIQPEILCLQEVLVENRTFVEQSLLELGLTHFSYSEIASSSVHPERNNSTAIYSRFPIETTEMIKSFPISELGAEDDEPYIFATKFSINNQEVHVITAHFYWSGLNELHRIEQAYAVTQYSQKIRSMNPKAVILLAGDLNATDRNDSIRYLKGEIVFRESSAYWTDAFLTLKDQSDWITSIGSDYWGAITAKGANGIVFTDLTPPRRIDYIFSYGWNYGGNGSPLNHIIWAKQRDGWDYSPSDHFGVYTDIYLPRLEP